MKYFLIAGERSGDLHGGNLVKAIFQQDDAAEVVGYGGDYTEKQGMKLLSHYRAISFMGFLEVIKNLGVIRRKIQLCKKEILKEKPDVLILIDFPGFNLRMAEFAHKQGIKTAYYISPKIWAWKKGRIKKIRRFVDKMYVIFPFEVPFYRELNYPVEFVGNPLIEYTRDFQFQELELPEGAFEFKVAFLPGSRTQEVNASIETIIALAKRNEKILFLVAGVDNLPGSLYKPLEGLRNVAVYIGKTYEILKISDASITTSGTATLETAILGVPQMVCYRTSNISYEIGKRVVKIKYISLVNLIADALVVKELIQHDYTVEKVEDELKRLLSDANYRQKMIDQYAHVKGLLTEESASNNTARSILDWLRST